MKPSDEDRLLREIFADENVERLRETTLARGLAAIRHRRRVRGAVVPVIAACALVTAIFTAITPRHRKPEQPAVASVARPVPDRPPIKIINDEELLALFPERNVALVGPPGEQKLIFLDGASTSIAALKNR